MWKVTLSVEWQYNKAPRSSSLADRCKYMSCLVRRNVLIKPITQDNFHSNMILYLFNPAAVRFLSDFRQLV